MEPSQERIDICICSNMQPNADTKALPFGCGFVCSAEDTSTPKPLYDQLLKYCCAAGQAVKNGVKCDGVDTPASTTAKR